MERGRFPRKLLFIPLLLGLSVVASAVVADRVRDVVTERSFEFGRNLGAFAELAGESTDITWNGQQVSFSATLVPMDVPAVMDHFSKACADGNADLAQEMAAVLSTQPAGAAAPEPVEPKRLQRSWVLQQRDGAREASGACLAGLGASGLSELTHRVKFFVETMDLSELGRPRYLHARKVAGGTRVLLISVDGPFSLEALAPPEGQDAPGRDPVQGARPRDTYRLVAAQAEGLPYGFTVYASPKGSPETMLNDYMAQVTGAGFAAVPVPDATSANEDGQALANVAPPVPLTKAFVRGEQALIVTASRQSQQAVLSVLQMDAAGVATLQAAASP